MKVYYSPASPFVRKVLVSAHELGVAERIELLSCAAHPINRDQDIVAHNPLGQVPTFFTDDGTVIYDSRVVPGFTESRSAPRLGRPPLAGVDRAIPRGWPSRCGASCALRDRGSTARASLGRVDSVPIGQGELRARSPRRLGLGIQRSGRYRHDYRRVRIRLSRFPVS